MFCQNCDGKIKPEYNYCGHCGQKNNLGSAANDSPVETKKIEDSGFTG